MGTVIGAGGAALLLGELVASGVVDGADIARAVCTTPRSVARWRAGASTPRRDLEERLLELAAVIDALRATVGDAGRARMWLRRPHPRLDLDKPLERIAAGGYRDVVALAGTAAP
ncbi:MAG TPA: antitoxin Xre/MbcA/ParS toxin-binding domain-containing protein [Egibacteraceae bacterium]|nr:antitoxin Xre/MbcA/ParS toxin-binding domain-containing protein [Egibacteraceae bacterium]